MMATTKKPSKSTKKPTKAKKPVTKTKPARAKPKAKPTTPPADLEAYLRDWNEYPVEIAPAPRAGLSADDWPTQTANRRILQARESVLAR